MSRPHAAHTTTTQPPGGGLATPSAPPEPGHLGPCAPGMGGTRLVTRGATTLHGFQYGWDG